MNQSNERFALRGGRVLTAAGITFERGTVLVEGSKITGVGAELEIPEGVAVFDTTGRVVVPGMVDIHTHLGIHEEAVGREGADYNEATDPVTPHLRALDAVNPEEVGMREAAAHGVTAAVILPGSANVVGGLGTMLKTYGHVVDRMILRDPCGMKVAFGENPKRVYGDQKKMPSTRMGTAGLLREALVKAQTYLRKLELGRENPDKLPDRDLKSEALGRVLRHELPLLAHCHRADDILTALRIAQEFEIEIILEHATEAHRVADVVAERGVPCVVGPSFTPRVKVELKEKTFAAVPELVAAGVKVAICSDHPVTPSGYLRLYAALAVSEGLSEEAALKAITIWPAEIMGVAERIGSLEPGKDADIAVFTGDPLDVRTRPEMVFIGGRRVPPLPHLGRDH